MQLIVDSIHWSLGTGDYSTYIWIYFIQLLEHPSIIKEKNNLKLNKKN